MSSHIHYIMADCTNIASDCTSHQCAQVLHNRSDASLSDDSVTSFLSEAGQLEAALEGTEQTTVEPDQVKSILARSRKFATELQNVRVNSRVFVIDNYRLDSNRQTMSAATSRKFMTHNYGQWSGAKRMMVFSESWSLSSRSVKPKLT